MDYRKRLDFLRDLDSEVWVEKRLSAARLVILDEIEANSKSKKFIISVIDNISHTHTDIGYVDSALSFGLDALSIIVLKKFKHIVPDSALTQFVVDLNIFGLREALAYIFESPNCSIPIEFQQEILRGYRHIGLAFLRRSEAIKQRLESILSSIGSGAENLLRLSLFERLIVPEEKERQWSEDLMSSISSGRLSLLERLVIHDATTFGGVWADGQPQHNLAES